MKTVEDSKFKNSGTKVTEGLKPIAGWWFQTCFLFFHILGIMIPTDELHHVSEG
jgi:hypothetical protein